MIQNIVLIFIGIFDFFYQKKIFSFLKKEKLSNFDVVFDVGAHRGESIRLFSNNFKVKKIISFEASPINFKFLKNKIKKYIKSVNSPEIIIENIALGSENKTIIFKHFNESSSSTIKQIDENSKYFKRKFQLLNLFNKKKLYQKLYQKFEIKIKKLRDYLDSKKINTVDFLKIDTEGYEYEILLGLEDKIKCVKIIMFEHHYDNMIKKGYTFGNINKLLNQNNFKKIYKSKMPFRKTFEYIYKNEKF